MTPTNTQAEVFNKAIEHDRYFSAAHFQLGVSNVMLDNLEKAIACFDSAYNVGAQCHTSFVCTNSFATNRIYEEIESLTIDNWD